MCGIAGAFAAGWRGDELTAAVADMTKALAHRGPDDDGLWAVPERGIAFGFRRLAILDLSPSGHQPMASASGRYTIVFNGEVYNYRELRVELESYGSRFRGHSDTEVLLAAFERWGVRDAVVRFIGMFALAVWDSAEAELHLIRDRLGIKPLYIGQAAGVVTFASELKSLLAGPAIDRSLNTDAVAAFLRNLYVPAPQTILRGAVKLLPGHILTIRDPRAPLPAAEPYWSVREAAARGRRAPFVGTETDAVDALERLLADAVALRLRSDVPLGAFLSGGVDSTVVAALMQAASPQQIRTFTIGFDNPAHDESGAAAAVAKHLGTDHTAIQLVGEDARALIPRMPRVFDEPFADASQLPTLLICEAARRELTVAISGDGGDEVFGGYNRYVYAQRLLPPILRMPRTARRLIGSGIRRISPATWDQWHAALSPALPATMARHRLAGEKLHKLAELLPMNGFGQMYGSLMSAWQELDQVLPGGSAAQSVWSESDAGDELDRMMMSDQMSYLPDDLLAKVDRASMAVSLEVRVPLLDHRVVELAWSLPHHYKVRDGAGKWILRQVLGRHVPPALTDRPKVGFTVPLADWLRGPLVGWAEDLLASDKLGQDGVLCAEPVRHVWRDFLAGRGRSANAIWAVLMLQAWREEWSI